MPQNTFGRSWLQIEDFCTPPLVQINLWIFVRKSQKKNKKFFEKKLEENIYSETLNNEDIGRIYQMSSWQFFNEFFTILRKFQYLQKKK